MIQSYNDSCVELEILMFRRDNLFEDLSRQAKAFDMCPRDIKAQSYDGMPKGCSNDISLNDRWENLIITRDKYYESCDKVTKKEVEINKIKEKFSKLEGLYYKVFYWHKMENKSLKEVSLILGYDYCYIREIWFKVKRIEKIAA